MPPNMAEWLPADHLVWFVIEVVEQLDTTAFHAKRRLGGQGRRGYDPDMLLALLLYAYAVGERSSRRIERLCVDHVAFRVVCAQDGPDHSTIARFRTEHEAAFADLFAQVLRLCAAAGMVKVGVVAIDGTKIAANAARGANRSHDTVRDEARRIAEEMLAEATQVDAVEDARAEKARKDGSDPDGDADGGLPAGFADHSRRAANIARALAEIERQDAEHAAEDEDDAKRVAEYMARFEAGESIEGRPPAGADPVRVQQARVTRFETMIADVDGVPGAAASDRRRDARRRLKDARKRLARAQEAAAAGTVDRRSRAALRRATRQRRARARGGPGTELVNVTDPDSRLMTQGAGGGSVQGYNAQFAVTDDHLVLGIHLSQTANDTSCYTPTLDAATTILTAITRVQPEPTVAIGTVLADAGYFTKDNLTTEGPPRLIAPGKTRDIARAATVNTAVNTAADAAADAAANAGPDSSSVDLPADAGPLELMRHRLKQPEAAELYKRRSATVEPVFGHLKDRIGLRRFSRRGLDAVTAELHLAATVLNLNRLHTTTA